MIRWSQANAIYQIYPRSFQDTDGDGVGDLAGITKRLPYLKGGAQALGVDAIWISPFFVSPMADFGYDVSDHTSIDPLFGTLDDFDELIIEAKKRDILVMLDFVPNHTSDQHRWFKKALSSKDNPYRAYYHFRDPGPDGGPPNNWISVFGGSAWEFDEASGQYYLHSFLKEQPDLNWEHPDVRKAMGDVLRFWLDRGVRGFRFDAIRWMAKDDQYRDDPINPRYQPLVNEDPYFSLIHRYSRYGEKLDSYLKYLTDVVDETDDTLIVFEDYQDIELPILPQIQRLYEISPVSVPINLEPIHYSWSPRDFNTNISRFQKSKTVYSNMVMCISNHDNPRVVSRFGDAQAKLIALIQLSLPGTPIIYYGDELGMDDTPIPKDQIQDPFAIKNPEKKLGRDPQRTPMQWDSSVNAGFSLAESTWLPMGNTHVERNVETELNDERSFLSLYRKLLKLRKNYTTLRRGVYKPALVGKAVYYYDIHDDVNQFAVMTNFSAEQQTILLNDNYSLEVATADGVLLTSKNITLPAFTGALIKSKSS